MFERQILYSVWQHILKFEHWFSYCSISEVIPWELVHIHSSASYILFPLIRCLILCSFIKMDPSAADLWLYSDLTSEQKKSRFGYRKTKDIIRKTSNSDCWFVWAVLSSAPYTGYLSVAAVWLDYSQTPNFECTCILMLSLDVYYVVTDILHD